MLTGIFPQFNIKITRTKLMLFALTLIAVGFALGGLETGGQDTDIANKVVNLSLPDHRAVQAATLEGVDLSVIDDTSPVMTPAIETWETVTVRSGESLDGISASKASVQIPCMAL